MRFMLFVGTDPQAEPYVEAEDNYAQWDRDLESRGVLKHKQRLKPAHEAVTVRVRQGRVLVTDGPFADTKETLAGLAVLECRNRAEAVAYAALHAMARFGVIEVREFWSFGEPPELPKGQGDEPNGYLLLVCNDPTGEPYDPANDNMNAWGSAIEASGEWTQGDRLKPAAEAVCVRVRNGELVVTDGPFLETKESIAGYDLLLCPDRETAVAIASRHPMARFGCLEVRPFWPR